SRRREGGLGRLHDRGGLPGPRQAEVSWPNLLPRLTSPFNGGRDSAKPPLGRCARGVTDPLAIPPPPYAALRRRHVALDPSQAFLRSRLASSRTVGRGWQARRNAHRARAALELRRTVRGSIA